MNKASLLGLALLGASCASPESDLSLSTHTQRSGRIIDGDLETGYPAVGALVSISGGDYYGAFCSGTLIDPEWVLTAAHCVEGAFGTTAFFVGNNANDPNSGDLYYADVLWAHPDYDGAEGYDVGLVHLADIVTDVDPIPYNQASIGGLVGDDVFYVGYGTDEGYNRGTSGIKRSTTLPIADVNTLTYDTDNSVKGVCSGDSGGPGLYDFGSGYVVIGVNSYVSSAMGDACTDMSNQSRIDAYKGWIAGIMDGSLTDCNEIAGLCDCTSACQPDGSCDNTECPLDGCGGLYDCVGNCGSDSCVDDCYGRSTTDDVAAFEDLYGCMYDNCRNAGNFQACVANECYAEYATCFFEGLSEEPLTCAETSDCLNDCGENDEDCQNTCYYSASSVGQDRLNDLFECYYDCYYSSDTQGEYDNCISNDCADETTACETSDECNPEGGDCGNGEACAERDDGALMCFRSDEIQIAEDCDPTLKAQCDDGLVCVSRGTCELYGNDGGETSTPTGGKDSGGCAATGAELPLWATALLALASRKRKKSANVS